MNSNRRWRSAGKSPRTDARTRSIYDAACVSPTGALSPPRMSFSRSTPWQIPGSNPRWQINCVSMTGSRRFPCRCRTPLESPCHGPSVPAARIRLHPDSPRNRLLKSYQEGTLASAWGPPRPPRNRRPGTVPLEGISTRRSGGVRTDPFFWKQDKAGQTLPYLDTLTLLIIQDRNAEALRFEAGEARSARLDQPGTLRPPAEIRSGAETSRCEISAPGFAWTSFVQPESRQKQGRHPLRRCRKTRGFRTGCFPAGGIRGTGPQRMVRSVYLGLATPQYGPVSSGNRSGSAPICKRRRPPPTGPGSARPRRPEGNRQRRHPAIWSGAAALRVRPAYGTRDTARERTAEIIRQNLRQAGLQVSIRLLLPNELIARILKSFDYEAILFGPTPTDIVPDLQADLWYSSGASHFWHPHQSKPDTAWEAELDTLTTRLGANTDPAVRLQAFAKCRRSGHNNCRRFRPSHPESSPAGNMTWECPPVDPGALPPLECRRADQAYAVAGQMP